MIVDDEPLARSRLVRQVQSSEGYAVVAEAANGAEALARAAQYRAEIVLMDIRMPVMDGLQAALEMSVLPDPPTVIFCTAYDEYALDAFEACAVAYLLKPVRANKLAAALIKAVELSRAQMGMLEELAKPQAGGYLSARSRRGVELIPLGDIHCLLADQKYVTVVHAGGEVLVDRSLRELEEEHAELLVRTHRNALVARAQIRGLARNPQGQCFVHLADSPLRPRVSRRHLPGIRDLIAQL